MSTHRRPKYLDGLLMDKPPTNRLRSQRQESRIARELKGMTTINSGATFGQNDVVTDFCEVEAKTTTKASYSLKMSDWNKLRKKCAGVKIPIMVVDFEMDEKSLAVIPYDDLIFLIQKANLE